MFAARNMMFARSSGAAPFDPLSLSPALWLDASDASTLYDAATGGSLVAADGAVARWEDKSGNSKHATQGTGSFQPVRKTAILNGLDIIRFDGIDNLLTTSQILSAQPATAFAVVKTTKNDSPTLGASSESTGGASIGVCARRGSGTHILYCGAVLASGTFPNTPTILTNMINGVSSAIYNCGSLITSGDCGTRYDIRAVGHNFNAGGGPSYFGGDIAEILVFPTPLSTPNRQAVERYLNAKWAIY
jgi:hypothetical protein